MEKATAKAFQKQWDTPSLAAGSASAILPLQSTAEKSLNYMDTGLAVNLDEWPKTGEIEFKNYSLRYRPDLPLALKNINLKIRDGQKVSIHV